MFWVAFCMFLQVCACIYVRMCVCMYLCEGQCLANGLRLRCSFHAHSGYIAVQERERGTQNAVAAAVGKVVFLVGIARVSGNVAAPLGMTIR